MSRNIENLKNFELEFYINNFEEFMKKVDAVYMAFPHNIHYYRAKKYLENQKYILCEKPITLSMEETIELYEIAKKIN